MQEEILSRLPRWKERASKLGITKIPSWKRQLFQIAEELCYYMADRDIDYILKKDTTSLQAENILRRYRLA